jgi:hypothetical protein
MRIVLLMAAAAGLLCAQDPPDLAGVSDILNLNQAQCLSRAENAMGAVNLPYRGAHTFYSRGVTTNDYYIIIACLPITGGTTWSDTNVAGRVSMTGQIAALRDCLGEFMRLGARGQMCNGGGDTVNLTGSWLISTDTFNPTNWTFTPAGAGRYQVAEAGGGYATGSAMVTGNRVQINWSTTFGYAGTIVCTIAAGGRTAAGTNTLTSGRPGVYNATMRRN